MNAPSLFASVLWALAGTALAWAVWQIVRPGEKSGQAGNRRREQWQAGDCLYRWLGGLIDREAAKVPHTSAVAVETDLRLAAVRQELPGAVYLARTRVASWLYSVSGALLCGLMFGWWGIIPGCLPGFCFSWAKRRELAVRARERLGLVRARLPFAVDLIAAQLSGGAGLPEAVQSTADELRGSPAGEELAALAHVVLGGRSLAAAARDHPTFQADPDLAAVAAEMIRAEEQGIPAALAFRGIARQLRLRAVQWSERSAEEAQIKMTGPVFLVAIACMVSLAAPFVLDALGRFQGVPR